MSNAELTFIGNATTLLRLGSLTLLTDPNFLHRGQRAYLGYGLWTKRITEPAMRPDQLPRLDGVVLSHLHGDHFDRIARRQLPADIPVLTTPHAARRLDRWGFTAATGMHSWHSRELVNGDARARLTAVPGEHGSGPMRFLLPPVMGTVIEFSSALSRPLRIYITGDTLYRPRLAQVAERCGPIDAMIIHLGGTRIAGLLVTMDGRQGAQLMRLLEPRLTVPVHYDDYTCFRSPLSDFVAQARQQRTDGQIYAVRRGETVSLAERLSLKPERR
jgi:L-ascorbate metabolism protein UlaG (beta-lactamase superfamily)